MASRHSPRCDTAIPNSTCFLASLRASAASGATLSVNRNAKSSDRRRMEGPNIVMGSLTRKLFGYQQLTTVEQAMYQIPARETAQIAAFFDGSSTAAFVHRHRRVAKPQIC